MMPKRTFDSQAIRWMLRPFKPILLEWLTKRALVLPSEKVDALLRKLGKDPDNPAHRKEFEEVHAALTQAVLEALDVWL